MLHYTANTQTCDKAKFKTSRTWLQDLYSEMNKIAYKNVQKHNYISTTINGTMPIWWQRWRVMWSTVDQHETLLRRPPIWTTWFILAFKELKISTLIPSIHLSSHPVIHSCIPCSFCCSHFHTNVTLLISKLLGALNATAQPSVNKARRVRAMEARCSQRLLWISRKCFHTNGKITTARKG